MVREKTFGSLAKRTCTVFNVSKFIEFEISIPMYRAVASGGAGGQPPPPTTDSCSPRTFYKILAKEQFHIMIKIIK